MQYICSSTTSQNHTECTHAYTGMMQEVDLDDTSVPAGLRRLSSFEHEPNTRSKLTADPALACKVRETPVSIYFRTFDTILPPPCSHSEQACRSCNTRCRWTATLLALYCGYCWDGNFRSATLRTCRFILLTVDKQVFVM